MNNITANGTIEISSINPHEHPVIRLNASFEGNGSNTPILHSWGVNWTNRHPVLGPPTGITNIFRTESRNISLGANDSDEYTPNLNFTAQYKYNLSAIWGDAYISDIHSNWA